MFTAPRDLLTGFYYERSSHAAVGSDRRLPALVTRRRSVHLVVLSCPVRRDQAGHLLAAVSRALVDCEAIPCSKFTLEVKAGLVRIPDSMRVFSLALSISRHTSASRTRPVPSAVGRLSLTVDFVCHNLALVSFAVDAIYSSSSQLSTDSYSPQFLGSVGKFTLAAKGTSLRCANSRLRTSMPLVANKPPQMFGEVVLLGK